MEWISVEDRLPASGERVLGLGPDGHAKEAYRLYNKPEWRYFGQEVQGRWGVTHWMPLPEPPKTARWVYQKYYHYAPTNNWYRLTNENGDEATGEQLRNALNGTAEELLEFAGVECECDNDPRKPYGYSQGNTVDYRIVEGVYGSTISPQRVCRMLNERYCKHRTDVAEPAHLYALWERIFEDEQHVAVFDPDGARAVARKGLTGTEMTRDEAMEYFVISTQGPWSEKYGRSGWATGRPDVANSEETKRE